MKPLLYVCAPWRKRTAESMRLVRLAITRATACGWVPVFAPFLFDIHRSDGSPFLSDEVPEERALAMDLAILAEAGVITEGMRGELDAWVPLLRPTFDGALAIETLPTGASACG